ncbi:MAG TPA: M23 family metallopeptidase [Terriglobales bacterium]|jgi:murein DD-endopeptidase MepM/ murein hydrolase activator NlpD|nr:M23 family metallopeptidase [Terriglobales bacterium]
MHERHHSILFVELLLIVVLGANWSAATPAHWMVLNQPVRLVNGSPVLFRVTTPQPVRSLSGNWLGHEIVFSFDATHKLWFVLAGVGQETKPGDYSLVLHAETPAGQAISFERKIHVAAQHYPRVLLKVPSRYTAPSPEDQHEIEKDKEVKTEAFKTVSPNREWNGSFAPPVDAEISDVFGVERVFNGSVQSTHQGLDFRVPSGTSVAAVNDGRVILAQPLFFEGNCIVIDHGQGLLTLYLHLSKFLVKEGDDVSKGQPVGLSGGTGRATGPHLHLAVRWQGVYLDPQVLLKLKLP